MNFRLRQMKIGIAFRVAIIGLASFMLTSVSAQTASKQNGEAVNRHRGLLISVSTLLSST